MLKCFYLATIFYFIGFKVYFIYKNLVHGAMKCIYLGFFVYKFFISKKSDIYNEHSHDYYFRDINFVCRDIQFIKKV